MPYRNRQPMPEPQPDAAALAAITGRVRLGEGRYVHAVSRAHPGHTTCGLAFVPPTGGRPKPTSSPVDCPGCGAATRSVA